ncbi:MAG TPA: NAD-dependent epimerase/dehydratase family protein [Draconibacterium sp.]|mgnify:CR=1 FL=1|nr:NAD-dependent epimerase/dehydratase family protein [Draconibacterium sp.]
MKILVTGTAGFIGYHLAKTLLKRGDTVVGIDNINDYYNVNLKFDRLFDCGISREAEKWNTPVTSSLFSNYSFIRMNLEDNYELNKIIEIEKFDVVCNLAAQAGVRYSLQNPQAYISSNIVGFVNILEACRHNNIQHLVYASSSSVYGDSNKMPLSISDTVDNPVSLYAATKKSNELMAHTYSHLYKFRTTGLRFFTVYGPWGRPDMAPILFANAIARNETIKVFNNGNLERDFTYIGDIVEGIIRVIDSKKNDDPFLEKQSQQHSSKYKIYNIGKGNPVKLMDFIETLETAFNKKAKKEYLPMQQGDVLKTYADVEALKLDFGYEPKISLKKGIEEFAKWYKSYYEQVL